LQFTFIFSLESKSSERDPSITSLYILNMPSSKSPQEWHRIVAENQKKPQFGLAETIRCLESNCPDSISVALTGWTHVVPRLLADSLRHNHHLQRLSLQACRLGNEGLAMLCPVFLQGNPPLVHVNLSGNGITDAGAVALAQAIQYHPTLRELLLGWNGIANIGTTALAQSVTKSRLQILDLAGVSEGRGGGSRDSFLLTDQLQQGVCNIGDVGCERLAQALTAGGSGGDSDSCSGLETLILNRQNHITSAGIAALSSGLVQCRHLKVLELQRIPVDDDGAVALASALNVSSSVLITLELAINKISDRGAKALAASLICNRTLQNVGLTQSAIGLEGLKALEAAMAVNTTLHRLELYGHAAGKEGSKYVWKIKPWLRMNRSSREVIQQEDKKEALSILSHLIASLAKLPDKTRLYRLIGELPTVFEATSQRWGILNYM
jgi:Ran GTPase-activating protein (RanGAP) involved in mRNA processing and transport